MATTIEGAIIEVLKADADTSALIGGRIHPATDPRVIAYPKLVYQRVNTNRSTEVGAFSNDGPTGLAIARVQFDAYAPSLLVAQQTAAAIRRALNGFSGTVAGVYVGCVVIKDERQLPATSYDGQNKPLQRQMIEVAVSYTDL